MSQSAERSAIEAAVKQQRFAISAEIHDSLLPYLFVTKMRLESLHHRLSNELGEGSAETASQRQQNLRLIEETIHSIDTAQGIGRNLLHSLDSDELLQDSWSSFLESTLARIATENVRLVIEGTDDQLLPDYVRSALRGVTREAITNAIRHGLATKVQVSLETTSSGQYQLVVCDNGHGFDPTQRTLGYGTRFMQVRAATIGASLSVDSQSGGPTIVKMTFHHPFVAE